MNSAFKWGFTNTISGPLTTCDSQPISILPLNTTGSSGTPPYYMQAFAVDGTPTTTLIGTNNQTVTWTPTHPPGTNLLLSVVDSTGGAGGVDSVLYSVIAGKSTQCVVNDNTNDFTISANVTDQLTTCQPWGLQIKGGIPPYNVTLAALNTVGTTNATLPSSNDLFTYINREVPGSQLSASISDSTGRWAKGTPLVRTQGSADVSCPGLENSSSKSTSPVQQQPPTTDKPLPGSKPTKSTPIIIGVCVAVGTLLLLGGIIVACLYRRHRQQKQAGMTESNTTPIPFDATSGQPAVLDVFHGSSSLYYPIAQTDDSRTSILLQPHQHPASSSWSSSSRITPKINDATSIITNEKVVLQHRDAGAVSELPPPYADDSGLTRSSR